MDKPTKKPRGKPFQKGGDSRICKEGGRKRELTAEALKAVGLTDTFLLQKLSDHINSGSEKMLELAIAYRFGKPIQYNEVKADITFNLADIIREARERATKL